MSYFFWGTIILFVATIIYYVVSVSLIYYWHEKNITYIVVPLIHTFEFFITAFLIMASFSIFLQYLPDIIKLANGG